MAPVRYRSFISDSARWDGISFREGDIVIAPPQKCGSTWMQMICALLVFQTAEFGAPLDSISPWVEGLTRDFEDIVSVLQAQQHRRFMKSHLPLDGLPFDERVTYICVGRDPRDAAISWFNHWDNSDKNKLLARRQAALGQPSAGSGGSAGPGAPAGPGPAGGMPKAIQELPDSPRERFWAWVEGATPFADLPVMAHHLDTYWKERERPNIVLLHYDDLLTDLPGQMRYLAGRLGIQVPNDSWPRLAGAATFGEMRRRATELAPQADVWHDTTRFFNRGTSGQWRELLADDDDLRRYREHVGKLMEPELSAWLHRAP
jgi:aryl sulfotransferase